MGRLHVEGTNALDSRTESTSRMGLILGTGWSDPEVLKAEGFELDLAIPFGDVGLGTSAAPGHPNRFLLGTWNGKPVVISQGRLHLYQDQEAGTLTPQTSLVRRWMSILLALMSGDNQLVITCSVGGLAKEVKTGMLLRPTGLVAAMLPMPYLYPSMGEFAGAEDLLWDHHDESETYRPELPEVFSSACDASGLKPFSRNEGSVHKVIPGPGYGSATDRRIWGRDCHSVGMSLAPEAYLTAVENWGRKADGEKPIRLFPALVCTDDHDLPDPNEITHEAQKRAPQLGRFLTHVVEAWL